MQIHTSLSPSDPLPSVSVDAAIVIDVLRATSVMTTALSAGADQIFTLGQVEPARALADTLDDETLLCGERACQRINGFDLGNSPSEYDTSTVTARTLILTTTNGTRAIERAESARQMYAASFLNLSATVHAIRNVNCLHLVCAGTDGQLSGEDVLLAGAIIDEIQRTSGNPALCDASRLALTSWEKQFPIAPTASQLASTLALTLGGRNLVRLNFGEDLIRCSRINQTNTVVARAIRRPACFIKQAARET